MGHWTRTCSYTSSRALHCSHQAARGACADYDGERQSRCGKTVRPSKTQLRPAGKQEQRWRPQCLHPESVWSRKSIPGQLVGDTFRCQAAAAHGHRPGDSVPRADARTWASRKQDWEQRGGRSRGEKSLGGSRGLHRGWGLTETLTNDTHRGQGSIWGYV